MIEWYDFYIFGSLATILASEFYPPGNPTANFLKTLATFAVGFAVRPLGALVFGRIGDLVGRKFAFLITLLIMGGSTAAIGFLPGYKSIGMAAPIILVLLRLLQGLALGGEYGGAAIYVAEHAPDGKRGFYTSFIQTTATLGLFVSLAVLFGAAAGQAVVWYTGQFYALLFLQTVLKVPLTTSYVCVAVALLLGAPFFVYFGSLSDRIGRKKIMLTGNLLAAMLYIPIYHL